MPTKTGIQWTDYSSNPLRYRNAAGETVWACVHASEGCRYCYAQRFAMRVHKGKEFTAPNMRELTPYLDFAEMNRLRSSTTLSGKRVFIGDMTDVFGDWVPFGLIDELFELFRHRKDVVWQVLTKRPDRMKDWADSTNARHDDILGGWPEGPTGSRPMPNLWLGTSIENEDQAWRGDALRIIPAAVHFLSIEPMLGPVTPRDRWLRPGTNGTEGHRINWVIAGGESGGPLDRMLVERGQTFAERWEWLPKPTALAWVRDLRDRCQAYGVPFFLKQWGGPLPGSGGRELDGRTWDEFPTPKIGMLL